MDDKVRAAIEYFAERVAHDLNNIITPLLAYPDILIPSLPDEKSVAIVRSMQESAERAQDVTQRLTALAGGGIQNPEPFDMSAVAAQAVAVVKTQLQTMHTIEVQEEFEKNLSIHMPRETFVRALEALVDNAIRALSQSDSGGTVSVKTNTRRITCMSGVGGERIPEGFYHILSVSDTGPGIPEEDLQSIIEPFVSKFAGKRGCGSGLGLSMAYCGLRRHGAYLQIHSTPETGTTASMYFPSTGEGADRTAQHENESAREQNASTPETEQQASVDASGSDKGPPRERILVVDDEHSICNLFKLILENFIPNILVDRAANGAEAFEMFKSIHYPVIVMDLHMPIMDGQACFLEIQNYCEKHDIKMPAVVFCTGYAPQATLRQAIETHNRHVMLNKPVQSEKLVKAVRERLQASAVA